MKVKKEHEGAYGTVCLLILVPAILWSAYVFKVVWAWHLVPIFGVPEIGTASAVGLIVLTHWFKNWRAPDSKNWDTISLAFILPATFLLTAWVARQFAQ